MGMCMGMGAGMCMCMGMGMGMCMGMHMYMHMYMHMCMCMCRSSRSPAARASPCVRRRHRLTSAAALGWASAPSASLVAVEAGASVMAAADVLAVVASSTA